jgi:hypothetical protein
MRVQVCDYDTGKTAGAKKLALHLSSIIKLRCLRLAVDVPMQPYCCTVYTCCDMLHPWLAHTAGQVEVRTTTRL